MEIFESGWSFPVIRLVEGRIERVSLSNMRGRCIRKGILISIHILFVTYAFKEGGEGGCCSS